MKKKDTVRPGILFYFDMLLPLQYLSDSEVGKLLRAAMTYGQTGELPRLSGKLAMAWGFLQPRIDADGERYDDVVLRKKYAGYCSARKRACLEPLSFEDWVEQQKDDGCRQTSTDVAICEPTAATTADSTAAAESTAKSKSISKSISDTTAQTAAQEAEQPGGNALAQPAAAPQPFCPPSVQDVKSYCIQQGFLIDPEKFISYFAGNDWKLGETRIRDWRTAVRVWAKEEQKSRYRPTPGIS